MQEPEYLYEGSDLLRLGERLTNYNAAIVDLIVAQLRPNSRVLDFGAGFGTLTRLVAEKGVKPDCVEPDARQRSCLELEGFRCFESIAAVADESYDFVYSSNVLEHIEDDVAALREIRRVLVAGGTLVLYLPAFQSLYTALDAAIGHFRRYDAPMIKSRIAAAGLLVGRCYYADMIGFLASWVFKRISNDVATVNEKTITIYDTYVFPLTRALERRVRFPFGKNVVAVAYRPAEAK